MLRVLVLLLLFHFAGGLPAGSQKPAVQEQATSNTTWRRFSGKDEEFSVLMPGQPSLYLNAITDFPGRKVPERIYSSYADGSVYLVVSYDGSSIGGTTENFKPHHLGQNGAKYLRDINLDGYKGKEYRLQFGEVTGTLRIYATKKHGYALATIQAVEDAPLRDYFFSSFSLMARADNQSPDVNQPKAPPNPASALPRGDAGQSQLGGKDVTRRAAIVSKPEPWYSNEARAAGVTGTVVLRVILSSSGEVKHINLVSGLSRGLTENAIEAARQIRFVPAVKDGRFVSYWIELQYNFGLY